jgi:hypothetical protein
LILVALLIGSAGLFLDTPWSLVTSSASMIALSFAVWSIGRERRRALKVEEFVELAGGANPGRLRTSAVLRMRRRASRGAPASARLRPTRSMSAMQAVSVAPHVEDAGDIDGTAERLAERVAALLKWDALWWFLAAVAVSIPVGIFVNHIS